MSLSTTQSETVSQYYTLSSFGGMLWRFQDSGIPRKELFICGSVVSNRASGFDAAKQATTKGWKRNMECFAVGEIDYLDQIMLDYPGPDCSSIEGELHRNFLIQYF